jgi:site-specific recombinase XerD
MPEEASNALLISNFLGHLQYERRAAKSTIAAHERSLAHLAAWLDPMWLPHPTRIHLQLYLGESLQGASARTVARRLSHFRHFYQFLLDENEIVSDPTEELSMPKHWTTAKAKGPQLCLPFQTARPTVIVATWVRMDMDAYAL